MLLVPGVSSAARDGDPCFSDRDCAPNGICVPGVPDPAPRGGADGMPGMPLPPVGVCDVLDETIPPAPLPPSVICPPGVLGDHCLPSIEPGNPVPIPRDALPSPTEPRPPVTPPQPPNCDDPNDPRCKT